MGPGAGSRYSPPDGPRHPEWRAPGVAPQDIWVDTLEVVGELKAISFEQVGARVRLTLPAHSLTAIAFERTSP